MARKPRLEVEGGLYHLITRGVDRRDIFHSPEDYQKFLSMLAAQKAKLPFYLYAYCLMTNHIHLLIERRIDDIGRIMHRVLTGYCQYYNRRYQRTGHVLQGRHKAILCQTDQYLAELARYIHLNPVRAKMVATPEVYPYSSHRAYLGLDPASVIDIDPVLRHFGPRRAIARNRFAKFVMAGASLGRQDHFYRTERGILGSEEFVDATIHRIGEFDTRAASRRRSEVPAGTFEPEILVRAVESVCGTARQDFCSPGKSANKMFAKEVFILSGRNLGAGVTALSRIVGISAASISRRCDLARRSIDTNNELAAARDRIVELYQKEVGEARKKKQPKS